MDGEDVVGGAAIAFVLNRNRAVEDAQLGDEGGRWDMNKGQFKGVITNKCIVVFDCYAKEGAARDGVAEIIAACYRETCQHPVIAEEAWWSIKGFGP